MTARRTTGAIAGALVGGLGITALMMAMEKRSGQPSELVVLGRASADRLGVDRPADGALPNAGEQAFAQGGHLLLSAAGGVAYAALSDENTNTLGSGLLFGLGFYALAHWVLGPALGVKAPEWKSDAKTIGMHTVNHLAFGAVTALGARLATRR